MRYTHIFFLILILVACGPEAVPREDARTAPPTRPQASPLIPTPRVEQASTSVPGDVATSRTMGNPAAPIVLIEYSDYQ